MHEKAARNSEEAVKTLENTGIFEVKPVGSETISAISIMGEKPQLAGNVLRRLCKFGGEACQQTCQLHHDIVEMAKAAEDKSCADANLKQTIELLGAKPGNVLMVGVGKDSIGFADEIDHQPNKYQFGISPVTSLKELPGYDAFFVREGDKVAGSEVQVLGRRLADCGDVNLELTDNQGRRVMGFMHMSKPNLQPGAYEYEGRKVGSFEYWLLSALDHYQADIKSVQIRVAAAIKPRHYTWQFEDEDGIAASGFAGWLDIKDEDDQPKLLRILGDRYWKPGKPFSPKAKWVVYFPQMIQWQMDQVIGLKPEQINWEGAIDPGDEDSQHASNYRGRSNPDANGRDAYFTAWTDKLQL